MGGSRAAGASAANLCEFPNESAVVVTGEAVHVINLTEADADTVALIAGAGDPEEATHQCLRIGARAVRAANVSLDTNLVEKSFDAMSGRIDEQIDGAVVQIADAAQALLDEETGALPAVLATHRADLEKMLGDAFDPESKRSVMAAFERVMTDAHEQQVRSIRRLVTLDGEDSPLVRVKREIVHDVAEHLTGVRKDLRDLSERIAVNVAVAPVVDITTAKGFAYEDVVHTHVSRLAAAHGDLAERVGEQHGETATKKGDELVTLNHEDTHGLEGRFVIEAKNRKLSMRVTLDELDQSLQNRGALAAVATFTTQEQAPTAAPFHYSDSKAIVVFDKDGGDDTALRLAYMWARWVVRRQIAATSGEDLNLARVASLIEDARRALDRVTNIKRFHSQAKRNIEQAADQVKGLVDEVEQSLDALGAELHPGPED